jgi:hypothetical protein
MCFVPVMMDIGLFTGQGGKQYPLKQYRVEVNGNILRVYN